MKVARAKGRLRGKQPKPNHRKEAHLVALFDTRDHISAELAELFGVTRSTVCRALSTRPLPSKSHADLGQWEPGAA